MNHFLSISISTAICQGEKEDYCPFFEELGYCSRPDSIGFMANYCSISCGICENVVQGSENGVVTSRYKLCVERALNRVISTSLDTLERFNVSLDQTRAENEVKIL